VRLGDVSGAFCGAKLIKIWETAKFRGPFFARARAKNKKRAYKAQKRAANLTVHCPYNRNMYSLLWTISFTLIVGKTEGSSS
jgi:hypothetical protein